MIAEYDVSIIGGGLAGLSLAIQSARAGHNTVLLRKNDILFIRFVVNISVSKTGITWRISVYRLVI